MCASTDDHCGLVDLLHLIVTPIRKYAPDINREVLFMGSLYQRASRVAVAATSIKPLTIDRDEWSAP
ncbi:MAG: hypothetical protein JKY94_08100 [Rhodobacteraceae bacterium]|nr:hypothetical protein [Paracoccaceae bacterium]